MDGSAAAPSVEPDSPSASQPDRQGVAVECPVCSAAVAQQLINKHLDLCLTRGEKMESLRSSIVGGGGGRLCPVGSPVYALLSLRELRRRLREYRLSTQGSRDQLIRRHQEFVRAYNAQCDAFQPKSAEDIAKEVESREKSRTHANNGDGARWEDDDGGWSMMSKEEAPSAKDMGVISSLPSPSFSDVSISSSICDIFNPEPDGSIELGTSDPGYSSISAGMRASSSTERDHISASLPLGDHTLGDHTLTLGDHTLGDHTLTLGDHTLTLRDHTLGDHTLGDHTLTLGDHTLKDHTLTLGDHTLTLRDHTLTLGDHTLGDHTLKDHTLTLGDHTLTLGDHTLGDHTLTLGDHTLRDHTLGDHTLGDHTLRDHTLTLRDHTLTLRDHTLTLRDHTLTLGDHTLRDHTLTLGDHTLTLRDHTLRDHTLTLADHTLTLGDHTLTLADHTLTLADPTLTLADPTLTLADHTLTLGDHTPTLADPTLTLADHTLTLGDHTLTLGDHTLTLADHTGTSFPLGKRQRRDEH